MGKKNSSEETNDITVKIVSPNQHDVTQVANLLERCYRIKRRSRLMYKTPDRFSIEQEPLYHQYLTLQHNGAHQ